MISTLAARPLAIAAMAGGFALCVAAPAMADEDPAGGPKHHDLNLVGFNDLQSRSSYQPTIHKQGNRYIAYVGHHPLGTNPVTGQPLPSFNPLTGKNEPNGTSLIDVTDPKHPNYLAHIPVGTLGNGGAQMVRVCDGNTLPVHDGKVYMLRSYSNSAHEIWDTTDPAHPVGVRTVAGGNPVNASIGPLTGTHKNWWECDTGIAYVVGRRASDTAAGWRPGNHIMIFNISNPANPIFLRDWALDGQQPGGTIPPHFTSVPSIHGPISTGPAGGIIDIATNHKVTADRVYFAYGTSDNGVMQVVDRTQLLASPANDFDSAELGRWIMNPINGAHSSMPMGKIAIPDFAPNLQGVVRDFVVVTSEETFNGCTGPRNLTYMVDVSAEGRPQNQANFQVPEASGDFCEHGGRFGPHSVNENFGPPFYQKLTFVAYFNAGVRAVDIRDPFNPKEVAFYIPDITAATDYRCINNSDPTTCKRAIQTNNVDTDDRGYVYIVDRANTGMHILQLTGQAAKIVK